jgi:transcription initiation factor IIE alpha subunit
VRPPSTSGLNPPLLLVVPVTFNREHAVSMEMHEPMNLRVYEIRPQGTLEALRPLRFIRCHKAAQNRSHWACRALHSQGTQGT